MLALTWVIPAHRPVPALPHFVAGGQKKDRAFLHRRAGLSERMRRPDKAELEFAMLLALVGIPMAYFALQALFAAFGALY